MGHQPAHRLVAAKICPLAVQHLNKRVTAWSAREFSGKGRQFAREHTLTSQLAHRFAWQADSLLDFACGRGGDLQKWFDAGVRSPVHILPVFCSRAGSRLWQPCLLIVVQTQQHRLSAGSICERHRPVTAGGGGGAAALRFREGASPATRCCALLTCVISCHKVGVLRLQSRSPIHPFCSSMTSSPSTLGACA